MGVGVGETLSITGGNSNSDAGHENYDKDHGIIYKLMAQANCITACFKYDLILALLLNIENVTKSPKTINEN